MKENLTEPAHMSYRPVTPFPNGARGERLLEFGTPIFYTVVILSSYFHTPKPASAKTLKGAIYEG